MTISKMLCDIIRDLFEIEERVSLDETTALHGGLPEFDSHAVIVLISALEEHFEIEFDDEDLTAATFATIGSLAMTVGAKLESN